MAFTSYTFPFSQLNDAHFLEQLNNSHQYPISVLNSLTYKPLNDVSNLHSVDNFLSNNIVKELKCNYYFSEDFSMSLNRRQVCNLLSFNISSVPRHFETFQDQCLDTISMQYDVIGLCETRLNDNIASLYNLNQFNGFYQNKSTVAGGVAIFLRNVLQGKCVNGISLKLPHIEALFIEVTGVSNFIVGMIYRPPNENVNDFLKDMENIFEFLSTRSLPTYIMGDFNIGSIAVSANTPHVTVDLLRV